MSGDNEAVDTSCCASCGIAEIDDIKLVPCDGCDLVRYCSDACREEHKSEHEEACKKRAAELRDELLFKQPESTHMGDCPICCLPLPLDVAKSRMMACCSKVICRGCCYADVVRQMEGRLQRTCPFCREPVPDTMEEGEKQNMIRIKANDPVALINQGGEKYSKGDYRTAFEYWSKAAELGDADAHFKVAGMYDHGKGVGKDAGKEIYHLEESAIGGHPDARYNLGFVERSNGNYERAVKHWLIAAAQGEDESIKMLMKVFKKGLVEKADLAAALWAHQAAVDATKSPQRLEAEEYYRILEEERGLY